MSQLRFQFNRKKINIGCGVVPTIGPHTLVCGSRTNIAQNTLFILNITELTRNVGECGTIWDSSGSQPWIGRSIFYTIRVSLISISHVLVSVGQGY